jgi:nitroreductase
LEVEEAILKRRSIRKFKDKPVTNGQIRKIIKAGTYAPSGKNGQPWRFTVLTRKEKEKITDLMENRLKVLEKEHGPQVLGSSLNSCRIMEEAPILVLVWNTGDTFKQSRLAHMMTQITEVFPDADRLLHMVELQGVSAAIQNMLLMAHSMDMGSLWINDIYYILEELEDYFDKYWELVAAISLGYPHESEMNKKPPSKYSVDEVTEFR